VAVTVSLPTGVLEVEHDPDPDDSVAVHSVVEPVLNVTEPVGVPLPEDGATVAE